MRRIFLSSVQWEFAEERKFLKKYIEGNPVLRRFFSVFAFELDVPAKDKTAKEVFLSELKNSDIYICLIGKSYGSEDCDGRSPTEVEFDAATKLGLPRLVFVKDDPDGCRAEKEIRFLEKVSSELSWVGFSANEGLLAAVYASLDELIVSGGHLKFGTGFTDLVRECREAGLKDPKVEDDKEFTVTIWRTANKLQTTKIKARELLDYVLKHPTMSVADLANELQIKPTTLRVRIDALKKLGLRHIGSRKSGKWILDAKI